MSRESLPELTADHLPAGSILAGKYILGEPLGVGGMGVVYAAQHSFTGKHCALKVLHATHASVAGFAERFLREARAAAEIGHPSVCDVYDAGREPNGTLYLVLELLEGEDLAVAMDRGDLTTNEIVEIGAQTLDGLAAAHARGIVHRDVKPENVFLTRDDRGNLHVKLLDFGVAKNLRRGGSLYNTRQGQLVGTPYYMAPEQAGGDDVDHRADIWSTGAMLFHALAGDPPFDADNYNKLMLKILSEQAPSLQERRPDLPEWLLRVVDIALRRNTETRWQSAAQMASEIRARGVGDAGLVWEEDYENSTTRTPSPFGTDAESLAPPPSLTSLGQGRLPKPPRPPVSADAPLDETRDQIEIEIDTEAVEKGTSGPRPIDAPRPFAAPPPPVPPAPPLVRPPDPTDTARLPRQPGLSVGLFIAGVAVGAFLVLVLGAFALYLILGR